MLRSLTLFAVLMSLAVPAPVAAQDCFPYATTTRFEGSLPLPSPAVDVVADATFTWVVTATELTCLDTSDPAAPALVGQAPLGIGPKCATLHAGFLVIGASDGVHVFDITNPTAPIPAGSIATPVPVLDLAGGGDLLLAALGGPGVRVYSVSVVGEPLEVGSAIFDSEATGVAARGAQRALVATFDALIDLSLVDPAAPVVLQTLTPSTLAENWPHFIDVAVEGNRAVVALWEDMPVARRGKRDLDDATSLLLLDLAALDPDDLVVGTWTLSWGAELKLADVTGGRALAHDGKQLAIFSLASPPAYPSAWQPTAVLEATDVLGSAAYGGGSIVVATVAGTVQTLTAADPVVVPPRTVFAPGEHVDLVGAGWAQSFTPHGFYMDAAYTYSLWDLRDPTMPQVLETVFCQEGFELSHSSRVKATQHNLVLREDSGMETYTWILQDWTPGATSAAALPTARGDAFFVGDLLIGIGNDANDWSAPRGLQVFDVRDPSAPIARGFLALGSTNTGARRVLDNRVLMATRTGGVDSLQVLDLADPDSPAFVEAIAIGGRLQGLRPWGDLLLGVDGQGDFWVLGLDPLRVIGQLPGLPPITGLAVSDDIAWLLWADDGLVAVDLADPAAPVRRGSVAVPGDSHGLVVHGSLAYVGGGILGLHAFDVSDPDVPVWLGGGGVPARTLADGGDYLGVPNAVLPLDCGELLTTPPPTRPLAGALVDAHPNPFNPRTTIVCETPRSDDLELAVFDLRGRRLKVLARGPYPAGRHELVWTGADEAGRMLPSGVYLVRLRLGAESVARKLTLAR